MPIIKFEQCAIQNKAKSDAQGRPVFEEGILATVLIDNKNDLKLQWPAKAENESWEAFCARVPNEIRGNWLPELEAWVKGYEHVEGTPVEQMPWLTAAQASSLKSAGVHSVEALAKVSDGVLDHLGVVGVSLRLQARAYLDDQSGKAVARVANMQTQLEAMQAENAELKSVLGEMAGRMKALETAKAASPAASAEPAAGSDRHTQNVACKARKTA